MPVAFIHWFCALSMLLLGWSGVRAAELPSGVRLLVELEAADFVTGADHWPQHPAESGLPGHFIPRGSPTRQLVAGAPAVVFDGDGDAFIGPITTAALHAPGAPHSVEVWAFQGNIRDQEALVSWGKRGGPDSSFAGFRYGSDPDFGAVALWASAETGYTTLPRPGRWHHLAFTYDGKRQAVYVDGRLDSAKIVGVLDAHDTLPILLGAELGGNRQPEGKFTHFSGAMGKVRISSGALDAAAIKRHFEQESPQFPGVAARPLARPPLHRFSFTAAVGAAPDGTEIFDSIGGLTAVVRGDNARFTGSGVRLPGGSSTTAAYLDFPNRMVSAHENVTIELWVTQEAALDWCRILSIGTNRSGEISGPGGSFVGSETLTLFGNVGAAPINRFARSEGTLRNGGPDRDPADYPESELGTGFHQVLVYDKPLAEWRWYRNGVLMEVIPDAEGPLTLDDVNVWLGRSEFSNDNNFRGCYHEVRIYNRTLEESEIYGNCQAGPAQLDQTNSPPLAQWAAAGAGSHAFAGAANWGDELAPHGSGSTATLANAVSGDQTIELETATTLGTLCLGARNANGAFTLVPRQGGSLTLDAGPAGPGSVVQLPGSLSNRLDVPLTLAADTEIANLAASPLVLGGPLHGPGRLFKTGPGPLVLAGEGGGFTGEARILTGSLVLGDGSGTLAASRFSLADDGILAVNRRDACSISPLVEGSGRFVQMGSGSLTLTESANLTATGFVDAADGAGPLISEGRIDGAAALRTDTAMVLAAHSNTRVREYLGVGFSNGGNLTIRDGASVTLTGGQGGLNVGDAGTGQSVLAMEGGTVFWKELFVGKNVGTSGVLIQTGGDLTKRDGTGGGDSRVGGAFPGTDLVWGACRLSGGTFTTDANLQIGAFGLGLLEIDGGWAVIKGFLGVGRFRDAENHLSRGVVDVTAGRLAITAPDRLLLVGEEGVGVLSIRNAGLVFANRLIIGAGTPANPGTGTVNLLQGGTLATGGIGQFNEAKATGSLYCNGGLLQVEAANSAFLEGLDSARIGPGGLTVNTNGFETVIAQELLPAAGQGVLSIPVTTAGSGFLAPPLIEITGGGGSGATAVARLTDGGIRQLIVTNPGSGYTSPPTVSVLGGGSGQGLQPGVPVLGPNRSGGLTKTGAGTLALTGASRYSGPTCVRQGELRVAGDLSAARGPVEVAADARLSGGGTLGGDVSLARGATLAPDQLRVMGKLAIEGTLAIAIHGKQAANVAVGGTLELQGATLALAVTDGGPLRQVHLIASYGALVGRFAETSLPPNFKLDYHHDGRNQIALVPTSDGDGK